MKKLIKILISAMLCMSVSACTSKTTTDGDAKKEDTPVETETAGFTYKDLADITFEYSSGAGAWYTEVIVSEDGSFEGHYQDEDMGDTGEGYDNGTIYECDFNGKFGNLEKVDDYTYKTTITSIDTTTEDEHIDEDEIRHVPSDPYGLDNAKDIYFYLPGKTVSELPEEYTDWVLEEMGDTTDFYGIFNENAEEGFVGYTNL